MAAAKTIYRVRHVVAADVAILSEVKEGDVTGGKVRETRDARMILGGPDSFWVVGTEKTESKFRPQKETVSFPGLVPASTASMTSRLRGSSSFDLSKILIDNMVPGQFDAVSFSSATRLSTGYSPKNGDDGLLPSLANGTLHIPLKSAVTAIEVQSGKWIISGFESPLPETYSLCSKSLRSVRTVTMTNRPEMIRVGQGIVVFVAPPKWSDPIGTDLRPQEEIFRSAEAWLSRSKAAIRLKDTGGPVNPADLLRMLVDSTASEEERADLAAISNIFSERSDLLDILPDILNRHPAFRERMATYEEAEEARFRSEIEQRILREIEAETAKLTAIQSAIADAETKLSLLSHRETLLREETEKHDAVIRQKIADAAEVIRNEATQKASRLLDDLVRLRNEIVQLTSTPAVTTPDPAPSISDASVEDTASPDLASGEQRKQTILELSVATSLAAQDVATIIALSTETVPVLIGADCSTAAVELVTAISGDRASVVFCDPTKVSLSDLLADEHSGLKASINAARTHPEVLTAVALCGITKGPCEYWLPQMVEMRRAGRLPRNLAFIASASIDGNRVSVPQSVFRHLFPLSVNGNGKAGQTSFKGAWPVGDGPDAERLRAVLEDFIEGGLEGPLLQAAAKAAARTPDWIKVGDLRGIFIRQAKWLSSAASGDDHDFNKYFKNIEG